MRGDPFWMSAKFNGGNCPKCGKEHRKGDRIFYYPNGRKAYCETDGKEAEADFRAHSEADVFSNY